MKRRVVLLAFLCVFLVPALGFGAGIPWPDWKGDDLTLIALWDNKDGEPSRWAANPDILPAPQLTENFYYGCLVGLDIFAYNYDNLNPLKLGFVYLETNFPLYNPTVYVEPSYGDSVWGIPVSNALTVEEKYYYIWTFELEPNPCWEEIFINFYGGNETVLTGDVFQREFLVGLATKCVVPIPGAIWLFGAGLLGLVGFRKKRSEK